MRADVGGSCTGTGRPTDPDLGRVDEEVDDGALEVWLALGTLTLGATLGRPTEPERGLPETRVLVGWPADGFVDCPGGFVDRPRPNEPDRGLIAGGSTKLTRGVAPEPDRGFVAGGFVDWMEVVVCVEFVG